MGFGDTVLLFIYSITNSDQVSGFKVVVSHKSHFSSKYREILSFLACKYYSGSHNFDFMLHFWKVQGQSILHRQFLFSYIVAS